MSARPSASLFVATYEMPAHLALVCAALERQSADGFEILFCDDGSGPETAAVIREFQARSRIPARHLWQEHQGFRKCRILNQALRESRGEVCVFLDGDCVPHKDYLRDHLEAQESGRYLAGRRVELGPELSGWLRPEHVRAGFFDYPHPRFIASVLRKDSQHLQRSVRLPWPGLRARLGMDRIDDLKGCNYSVPRAALEALNGFDEEYEGYGREDTDIELRLQNHGLRIKSLKGVALQFHVWHPRREFTPANDRRLDELKRSGRVRCEQGLVRG
jgi:glycosyltransferase involved in cell wall biosynthesis